jgi:hypothetical protein
MLASEPALAAIRSGWEGGWLEPMGLAPRRLRVQGRARDGHCQWTPLTCIKHAQAAGVHVQLGVLVHEALHRHGARASADRHACARRTLTTENGLRVKYAPVYAAGDARSRAAPTSTACAGDRHAPM